MLSCSEDFSIRYWDIKSKRLISIFEGHHAGVLCLDYHWIDNFIVSGGRDSKIIIWKFSNEIKNTQNPHECYKVHKNSIIMIKIYGNIFITLGDDSEIIFWQPLLIHSASCVDILSKFQVFPSI